MIDNALDFCYRSSSIVGTTTNYDYEYNRAVVYLFWLARRLERQVGYIEPDGKIWTKLYNALSPNGLIYPGTWNFKDGTLTGWTVLDDADCSSFVPMGAVIDGHRNYLRLRDDSAGGDCNISNSLIQGLDTVVEFYATKSSVAADTVWYVWLYEGGSRIIYFYFVEDDIYYYDGAAKLIKAAVLTVGTFTHFKLVLDDTANTFDCYIDGDLEGADLAYENNTTSGIDTINLRTNSADTGYSGFIHAIGISTDPAYTVGDNEVAWDLNNHWQNTRFVDIPDIEEVIQGFFEGNTGITRNTIRYKNNATSIRPVAATREPIEQLKGILSLNEFRDPKIEASTEADQLGDNRYAIWAATTIYLGLRIEGQGYLQEGKTVHIKNTGDITVAESNLLVLAYERDPKNDVYLSLILSDNIIYPSEFSNLANTTSMQTHTAAVQAIENQYDINLHLTREGGIAVRLTNETGAASIKGTLVTADATVDNAFDIAPGNSVEAFGVVYENGIADGAECLVCIGGRVEVLLKDATAATRGNWAEMSDVAGRADITNATPAAAPQHFQEIGHGIENKGADTDVLAFIIMHFL